MSLVDENKAGPELFAALPTLTKFTRVLISNRDSENGRKCFNQYQVIGEIGRGEFGKVKLCIDERDKSYAVKICRKPPKTHFGSARKINQKSLHNEIEILKKLQHPNIVFLHEVIDSPEEVKVFLLMEYLNGGHVYYR
eukprot:Awhi_evm1s2002